MVPLNLCQTDALLTAASKCYSFVLVPGLYDSGPEHWQSDWQRRHGFWQRIAQRDWNTPDIDLWIAALKRVLGARSQPSVLVGHSFGALASCCLTVAGSHRIAGLMLVAPAEPSRFELEQRVPKSALGVPAVVVASHNDPVMRFSSAVNWSNVWRAEIIDVGEAGHINAEAGFGPWPYGLVVLAELVKQIDQENGVK